MLRNYDYLEYTYLHRKAVLFCIERYIKDEALKEELLKRAKIHDLDKATLYTLIGKKEASAYHRKTASHHMDNDVPKSILDYYECILDYQSASLSKPDKPLNAYDTVVTYHPCHEKELLEIMHELGIDYSYSIAGDKEFETWIQQYLPVTEEKILEEIYWYLGNTPNNVMATDWKKVVAELDFTKDSDVRRKPM